MEQVLKLHRIPFSTEHVLFENFGVTPVRVMLAAKCQRVTEFNYSTSNLGAGVTQ
jgi:hypothetical protein